MASKEEDSVNCDWEVVGWTPGPALLPSDLGQVVHTMCVWHQTV